MLLNKVELAGEAKVDETLDDLNELVPDTPKVRTVGEQGRIDSAVMFGLDAALWRSDTTAATSTASSGDGDLIGSDHMSSEAECYHVLPRHVPTGWSATRAMLEAMMAVAPPDDLYRTKGVVPFTFAEAAEEAKRQGIDAPRGSGGNLGDTWWLFNGVAGRMTLEPLTNIAGPASLVFMGRDLKRRTKPLAAALGLPPMAVTNAAIVSNVQMGGQLIGCGVARGLCAPLPDSLLTPAD